MTPKLEAAHIAKEILVSASNGMLQAASNNNGNSDAIVNTYNKLHQAILISISDDKDSDAQ